MRIWTGRALDSDRPRRGWARRLGRVAVRLSIGGVGLTVLLVLPLRWIPPPTSAFMLRARFLEQTRPDYRWIPLEAISPNLAIAAVAAEDQRFPDHPGFDVEAIREAFDRNRSESGRLRGGSTITQQVAKNLYLWPAQSLVRKGAETWLALWIELLWPKRRILEVYLNIAEFGEGAYGAEAASRRAFGKPASGLSMSEAARLGAVLPSPRRMSIVRPSDYVLERTRQIVDAAGSLGPGYRSGVRE
jgi:monofunctional biosynthetic peptidoglycan transglycosylase